MRVAYLVDLAVCPDELLDAVFAEAYGRWGGRRTLIVPATAEGIDERYEEWLRYLDPDVIYSFVDLNDAAVATMHERYAPAYLIHHKEGPKISGGRSFEIKIPYVGLSSLSVLSALCSRSWGFYDRPANVKVLDKFWDSSESRFLEVQKMRAQTTKRTKISCLKRWRRGLGCFHSPIFLRYSPCF